MLENYGWAAGPACVATILELGGDIVELGSGESTRSFRAHGRRVLSFEHDRKWLRDDAVFCPLLDGWYDRDILRANLRAFGEYGVLFVDGPVGSVARCRFSDYDELFSPAVPWVFDDVHRPAELEMVATLSAQYGRPLQVFNDDHGKRFAVLFGREG